MRQPGDDLQAVELLLLRVLPVGGHAFAVAKAADIDPSAHVSATHEVGIKFVVPLGGAVVLAIGVILEHRRKFLAASASVRHVQRDRQANTVLHRNPSALHADVVGGRGWRLDAEGSGYHQPQQGHKKPPEKTEPDPHDSYQRKPWRCSCSSCFASLRVRERRWLAQASTMTLNNAMGATYEEPNEGVAIEVRKNSWANCPMGDTSVF